MSTQTPLRAAAEIAQPTDAVHPHAPPAIAQNTRLLGTAHTAHVISDVVFNKDQKYLSAPIPTATLYRTGLFKVFREVESNPEIEFAALKGKFPSEERLTLKAFRFEVPPEA